MTVNKFNVYVYSLRTAKSILRKIQIGIYKTFTGIKYCFLWMSLIYQLITISVETKFTVLYI